MTNLDKIKTKALRRLGWVGGYRHNLISILLTLRVIVAVLFGLWINVGTSWPYGLNNYLGFLIVGIATHSLGLLGHETYHNSFFVSRRTNEIVGKYVFHLPLGSNFSKLKEIHLAHHRYVGTSDDPDRIHWDWTPNSKAHRFYLLKSLTGVHFFESVYQFLKQMTVAVQPNRTNTDTPSRFDLLQIIGTQGVILLVFSYTGHPIQYFTAWLLPILIVGRVIEDLRLFCEHFGGDTFIFEDAKLWERILFSRANFQLHGVHHLAPSVPWFVQGAHVEKALARGSGFLITNRYLDHLKKI